MMATADENNFRRVLERLYARAKAGDAVAAWLLLAGYAGDVDALAKVQRLADEECQ
jgi:hypothetical protein